MRRQIKIFAILTGLTSGAIITANLITGEDPTEEVIVDDITEREEKFLEDYEEVLYGGRPIGPGELTPSVWIGNCTGTVVSESVLITAAHCKANGSSLSFNLKGVRHTGRCERHPQYNRGGNLNNDFLLCTFSPKAILEEYGDLSPITSKVGDMITMQGYGQGSNGKLNWGDGVIVRMNSQDIITQGRLALGSGDSGGALFAHVKDRVKGPFRIVGINSRGGRGTSLFNITSLERSQKFFKDFAKKHSVEICGVTSECIPGGESPDLCHMERGILKDLENDFYFAKAQKDSCTDGQDADIGPALINGQISKPEDWPEVLKILIGQSSCSATLVAPNVILTAAHCGSHGAKVRTTIAGKAATGTCYRHPSYPRQDVDIMACKLDQSFDDVKPASVTVSHAVGDIVTIAGYGCTRPGGGGADGKLRNGNAKIFRYSAYDIISGQGAALCYGDSGGPMFKKISDPKEDPHLIIGVNSKGNIQDTSYNTRLDLKTSQDFLKRFELQFNVKICGISAECDVGVPLKCGMEKLIIESLTKQIDHAKELVEKCEL